MLSFTDGWNIPEPDYIIRMPSEFEVADTGVIDYVRFVLPTGFTEDKWVSHVEVRPGNRSIVHHVIASVRPKGSQWLAAAEAGVPVYKVKGSDGGERQWPVGFAPGNPPPWFKTRSRDSDSGPRGHRPRKCINTPSRKRAQDRTQVGVVFAKEPPAERILASAVVNTKFVIPPGAANYRVDGDFQIHHRVKLTSLAPHMHPRGKAFEFRAVYPSGEKEVLEATGWYDNSANDPHSPDPKAEVKGGDQSFEEMLFGAFAVALNPKDDPKNFFRGPRKPAAAAPSSGGE